MTVLPRARKYIPTLHSSNGVHLPIVELFADAPSRKGQIVDMSTKQRCRYFCYACTYLIGYSTAKRGSKKKKKKNNVYLANKCGRFTHTKTRFVTCATDTPL